MYDLVLTVLAGAWERVDDSWLDAITSIGWNRHADPVIARRAQRPVVHVIDRSRSGGRSTRCATCFDDRFASLLDFRNESITVPTFIDQACSWRAINRTFADVRILRCRVIAPNDHLLDVIYVLASFLGELTECSVVIESCHRGELFGIDFWRGALSDQAVRVCRVTDDEHANVFGRVVVDRFSLRTKDLAVCFEQVFSLHAFSSWPGTDQQGIVGVLKADVSVVRRNDAREQRKRAVIEFHDHAVEGRKGRRNLEQLKNDGLIRTQHVARGDAEGQGVSNVSCSTGDRYVNGRLHNQFSCVS